MNPIIDKQKKKEINKLKKKIKKIENQIQQQKRKADFDRRYSKEGQLSDSCCKLDDMKINLINLINLQNELKGLLK